MEKIHGSNLQFIVNSENIAVGKRNSVLLEEDKFANFKQIRDHLRTKLFKIRELVGEDIIVYGEIFGGYFPKDLITYEMLNSGICVQKGIYYCPDNRFSVFDIRTGDSYLGYDEMERICQEVDILYCEALHRGSFEEMKALNPTFLTTYPQKFGLPEIAKNIAEGYVIRPVKNQKDARNRRRIYKHKAPSHTERSSVKVEVEKTNEGLPSERSSSLAEEIAQLICDNRLSNVLSKIGPMDKPKQILMSIYTGKLIHDAIDEYGRENNLEITSKEKKYVVSKLSHIARSVVENRL